ncbi:MAG: lipid-binding SYLF domain-containing protein [Planctomycetota bacterium]|jgi:lipid-binding SYLF domain-containing protein
MSKLIGLLAAATVLLAACQSTPEETQTKSQRLVDDAAATVTNFKAIERNLPGDLEKAKAIVIFPKVTKAGLGVGYSGGRGVMLTRDEQGNWSQPAFCAMEGPLAGLLAGGSQSRIILAFMSKKSLDKALAGKVSLGIDASVAAGREDRARAGTGTKDIYAYARGKGGIINVSVDGLVFTLNEKWIRTYYDEDYNTIDILVRGKGEHEGTIALRKALQKK